MKSDLHYCENLKLNKLTCEILTLQNDLFKEQLEVELIEAENIKREILIKNASIIN